MLFPDQIQWVLGENLECMLSERQLGKEIQNGVGTMG